MTLAAARPTTPASARRVLGRVLAAVAVSVLVVAPPVVVLLLVGRPVPSWSDLRDGLDAGRVSDETLIGVAASTCLLCWAWATVVILGEAIRTMASHRRRSATRAPITASDPARSDRGAAGALRRLVRHALVGTVAVSATITSLSTSSGARRADAAAMVAGPRPSTAAMLDDAVPEVRVTTRVATGRETPLSLAVDLGDETLRSTIIELNRTDGWHGGAFPAGREIVLPLVDPPTSTTDVDRGVGRSTDPADSPSVHSVVAGDSLWSIARDRLGLAERWPELWELNGRRTMADGAVFDDPDLIRPGWQLRLPTADGAAGPVADAEPDPSTVDDGSDADVVPDGSVDPVEVPPASAESLELPEPSDIESPEAPEVSNASSVDAPEGHGPATRARSSTDRDPVAPEAPGPVTSAPVTSTPERVSEVPAPAVLPPPVGSPPVAAVDQGAAETAVDATDSIGSVAPMGIGGAMLSAGLLGVAGAMRRRRLRAAAPGARLPASDRLAAGVERRLRSFDARERLIRLDIAIRSLAGACARRAAPPRLVLIRADGAMRVELAGPAELPAPWVGTGTSWSLAGDAELDELGALATAGPVPCPTIVQIGVTPDGADVFVDLEAIGHLDVTAPAARADAVVAGIAALLGSSPLAEVAHLVGVGLDPETFVRHPGHVATDDLDTAVETAATAIGTPSSQLHDRFVRRATSGGDAWEPAVVLADSSASADVEVVTGARRVDGIALVTANASTRCEGAVRVVDDGRRWLLTPGEVELVPVGLDEHDVDAIGAMVASADRAPTLEDAGPAAAIEIPDHRILVRLLGPVDVVGPDGIAVTFERSKTKELVAWLSTHRRRSSRTAARTALWELDVRDATFANVVSEARRAMARAVPPPDGEEWLGRTLGEDLPLHDLVRTDAEVVEALVVRARTEPDDVAVETLRRAVRLVRGLPFEGTSYLWPDGEGLTSNLVLLSIGATADLARRCLDADDVEGVFEATGIGLAVVPGHEELIALRMRARARGGDLAGLRQEWESYERALLADTWSDGEPAAKLVELRTDLVRRLGHRT